MIGGYHLNSIFTKMQTKLILVLFIICAAISCASGGLGLPTLAQPKYFENDTVQWFPEIFGGTPVEMDHSSSVVSIQNRYGFHLCSGTLVSFQLVLTAASCLLDEDGNLLDTSEIRIIADDTLITGDGSATRQVQEIGIFYIRSTSGIAIIELLNTFVETATFTFAEIANDTVYEDQICQVVGWGASLNNSEVQLQIVDVKIVSNEVANSSKYYDGGMPSDTIAAASLEENSSCFGDLGSVLLCDDFINGILLFGYGCNRSDFPTVFRDIYNDDLIADNRIRMLTKPSHLKRGGSRPSVIRPGAGGSNNSNNKNQTCVTNEAGERVCNEAGTLKLSALLMLSIMFQYVINKIVAVC